jgi:hypothetical protein
MLGGIVRTLFKILVQRTDSKLGLSSTYETKYCLATMIGMLWPENQAFYRVMNTNQIYALPYFLHNYPLYKVAEFNAAKYEIPLCTL